MGANVFIKSPQEWCWPVVQGVDYGAGGRVLMRDSKTALIWFPGRTVYAGRMTGNLYDPMALMLITKSPHHPDYKRIFEGGRMSIQRIQQHGDEIDDVFGGGSWKLIELDKTIALSDPPWFSVFKLRVDNKSRLGTISSLEKYDD